MLTKINMELVFFKMTIWILNFNSIPAKLLILLRTFIITRWTTVDLKQK